MSLATPILFCVFNRPEVTRRVFRMIARQRPQTLLIAGDGPRPGNQQDEINVPLVRQICQQIDWPCEVETRFPNQNQGCRNQMAAAISWAFEQHERVIVLEDDCLPNDSFFPFCEDLLERYADHSQVMTICGVNHLSQPDPIDLAVPVNPDTLVDSLDSNPPILSQCDYRFSKYPLIWGWASWRRAWQHYDLEMEQWNDPTIASTVLQRNTDSVDEYDYWHSIFSRQAAGEIDTWDYSWTFASWLNDGLTIVPAKNLISNVGFGSQATHTTDPSSPFANLPVCELKLSKHPDRIERDAQWDRLADRYYFPRSQWVPPAPKRQTTNWRRWFSKFSTSARRRV